MPVRGVVVGAAEKSHCLRSGGGPMSGEHGPCCQRRSVASVWKECRREVLQLRPALAIGIVQIRGEASGRWGTARLTLL